MVKSSQFSEERPEKHVMFLVKSGEDENTSSTSHSANELLQIRKHNHLCTKFCRV